MALAAAAATRYSCLSSAFALFLQPDFADSAHVERSASCPTQAHGERRVG